MNEIVEKGCLVKTKNACILRGIVLSVPEKLGRLCRQSHYAMQSPIPMSTHAAILGECSWRESTKTRTQAFQVGEILRKLDIL